MKELTCIVCPNGCTLKVTSGENGIMVEGARCKRGETFAKKEMTAPTRSVCTTVKTIYPHQKTLSVRTDGEIPKNKIFPLMRELKKIVLDKSVKSGDVIAKNVCETGVDVIATTNLLGEEE